MAGFALTGAGTRGVITLSSANGSSSGGQANVAVGGPFTIYAVAPTYVGCSLVKIVSISAQWVNGKGQFLRKVDYTTGNTLTEVTFDHSIIDPSAGILYNVTLSPQDTSFLVNFYLGVPTVAYGTGVTSIQDTLSITVNYNFGASDSTAWNVNMQIPTMALNFVYPQTASTKFQFGPFQYSHMSGGTEVFDYTQLAWNNAGYLTFTPATTKYGIGLVALGQTKPWQISGSITNSTNSTGAAYMVQLVANHDTEKAFYSPGLNGDVDYKTINPPNVGGQWVKGLDNLRTQPGIPPYTWGWSTWVGVAAQSASTPVPAINAEVDGNGNPVSYYGDQPGQDLDDVTLPNAKPFPYKFYFHAIFKTYMVFQADGGIPIGISSQNWQVDGEMDNSTAKTTPTRTSSLYTQTNWVGTTGYPTPSQTIGTSTQNTPSYILWNYVAPDLFGEGAVTPRAVMVPFVPVPNAGLFGGMAAIQSPYGIGYPRSAISNVATFCASAMN